MSDPPAVIVHGLGDAHWALAIGRPVTLLSAPGAALFIGCGFWWALVEQARTAHPGLVAGDILDCADATGYALSALRLGQRDLVLWPSASGRTAFLRAARVAGATVRDAPPPALDLANATSARRLAGWLAATDDGAR